MNAYTVSRLALDAGVSVHIVRDYLLRGLLRPVACTPGGYGLFDDAALQRLCFVRAAFEAGIGLDEVASGFDGLVERPQGVLRKAGGESAMGHGERPVCSRKGHAGVPNSSAKWQRARWPPPMSRRRGASLRQRSRAKGQRV